MTIFNLAAGMKLLQAKNYEAVYAQSVEALKKDEKNPLAFFLLGVLAANTGDPEKALEFFAKATEYEPSNVRYQTYHAKALNSLGLGEQAKQCADIAAEIGTKDAFLADMIGIVYSRTGYHDLAIPFFETATKSNPKWAKFQFNLGASAEFIGNFDKARAAYANALALDPKFYLAWFSLVALEKQSDDKNNLDQLIPLFNASSTDAEAQLLLGHSIAKTLEDLERYQESLEWLTKGKRTKKEQSTRTTQDWSSIFAAAKATAYPRAVNQASAEKTTPKAALIFIVGLPRTGTTLVDRILSSHEQVRSAGEINLFSDLIKLAAGMPVTTQIDTETLLAAGQLDLAEVGTHYLKQTETLAQGAAYLVNKTPFNFFFVSLIHRALPNARIIALRRGAMDSCLSNYRQLFATHNNNYDYTFDLEDMARFYGAFDGLMRHWRQSVPADRFMEFAYEDIVFDQENQTRKLLSFCDLPWDEACLNFHENNAPVSTASAVQVRQPLYSGSIGRWKKYGRQLDTLKAALGDLAN